jgi:hypothetical protein
MGHPVHIPLKAGANFILGLQYVTASRALREGAIGANDELFLLLANFSCAWHETIPPFKKEGIAEKSSTIPLYDIHTRFPFFVA